MPTKKTEATENAVTSLIIYRDKNFRETSEGRAVATWADVTTDKALKRAADIERDKKRDASEFFGFCQKPIEEITADDVREWSKLLQRKKRTVRAGKDAAGKPLYREIVGLKPATIATKIAHLSAFFEWLRGTELGAFMNFNPARIARPSQAYSSESTQSLSDEEITRLWQVIADHAHKKSGKGEQDVLALRDYAIFRLFMATGMRRSEILNLTGKEVQPYKEGLLIRAKVKGGDYKKREIADPQIREGLESYLAATGRAASNFYERGRALWLRHDRAEQTGSTPMSSHAFAERMKIYAREAGIGKFHLHQLRHTFARLVSEESGSIIETQDALDHKNVNTTRVYVQKVGIKRDKFSSRIQERIKPKKDAD
jgi:integrase